MASPISPERDLPEVAGVRHDWVQAGDVRLHVAEAGAGPPLVLLHGWPQHWYEWREVIGPLARDRRVICPDLRGFGWSEAPSGGYDKETMAADVIALLDALGVERFAFAGHDWGGWIGCLIGLQAPERVERLMVLNVGLPFSRPGPRALATAWRLWYQMLVGAPLLGRLTIRGMPALVSPALRWIGGDVAGWEDEARESFLDQFREPERARASEQLYRTFMLREAPAVLAGRYREAVLDVRALVLHGADDAVVRPPALEGFERNAPRMRVELVPGVGHFIVDQRPELVVDRLRALLAEP
jgi:pimeloyl-ACP methyl ester carboxylesterase